MSRSMQRITDVAAVCICGWIGTVGDTEPDIDGDGSLGCPRCQRVIHVTSATPISRKQEASK